jgi:hypothetical protein
LKRFFLSPFVVLLMLLPLTFSGTALVAHAQQTVSTQQTVRMQQLHMWAHQVSALHIFPVVTCSRNGCTGQDPAATGCSADATTLLSKKILNSSGQSIGEIDLRWSPTCQTNWARVVSSIGSVPLGASVEREAGVDGPFAEECEPTCDTFVTATSAFTDMVWAPDVAAAATGGIIQNNTFFKSCVTQDSHGLPC